jgi:hypothetical protein
VDSPFHQLVASSQQSNLPADARLNRIRQTDGALFELLDRYGRHDKTDVFRDVVAYHDGRRKQLAEARALKPAEAIARLAAIQAELGPLEQTEAAIIIDLYLSYRAVSAWGEMRDLYDVMPIVLRQSVLVREQRAFALNRLAGKSPDARRLREDAVQTLDEVLAQTGPNPETYGLLGRVHKDRWQEAAGAGRTAEAAGHLRASIAAYVSGFESDSRDAYPGVNAVTLLDVEGSERSLAKKRELLPVVHFAVARRIAGGKPDYWDRATLAELSVLEDRPQDAREHTQDALAAVRESWEAGTTANNLGFIRAARAARGVDVTWLDEIIGDFRARAAQ